MNCYSVLMSVYAKDKAEWVSNAIDSMLSQTIPPSQFVLVIDGPIPEDVRTVIVEYAKNSIFSIVALKKNMGLGAALHEGILCCKNELVARMDADDISAENRCERQLQCFECYESLDVVGCWENEFWKNVDNTFACHKVPERHNEIFRFMKMRCGILHPTVMFKKSAVLRAGNYRTRLLLEDYDLFVRMLRTGAKAYNIQEPLYYLRVNPDMFMRRGGFKYAKTLFLFKYQLWKENFSNIQQFIISAFGQIFVCLLPNRCRAIFYKLFLR
jgi:glycosyltransferase involved in cell wall biosynthesis